MRGFRASLYKDLRLFFRTAGFASFLLPLLLSLLLFFGLKGISGAGLVRPFAIAIRDEDQTLMSRSLLSQMREIRLFSELRLLSPEESDEEALQAGAAGVITIPESFFYALYSAEDCPVTLQLNKDDPLGSALLSALFSSAMEIIQRDEAAMRGAFSYLYEGREREEILSEIHRITSERVLMDALGRQKIFSERQSRDTEERLFYYYLGKILAGAAVMLGFGFAIPSAASISEERKRRILPRYLAAGGSRISPPLSRLFVYYLMLLPFSVLSLMIFPEAWRLLLPGLFLCFLGIFLEILLIERIFRRADRVRQLGNLLLMCSLLSGGIFWPRRLFPPLLRMAGAGSSAGRLELLLRLSAEGAEGTEEAAALFFPRCLLSLLVLLLLFLLSELLSSWASGMMSGHQSRGLPRAVSAPWRRPFSGEETGMPPGAQTQDLRRRGGAVGSIFSMGILKLKAFSGGYPGLLLLLAAAVFLSPAIRYAEAERQGRLGILVLDEDRTEASEALFSALSAEQGIAPERVMQRGKAEYRLRSGETEGILTIPEGYEKALCEGGAPSLQYEAAGEVFTEQAMREIIAGKVLSAKSRFAAENFVAERLGRPLLPAERLRLQESIEEEAERLPALYRIEGGRGRPAEEIFLPDSTALALLYILFILLMLGEASAGQDAKRASLRLRAEPRGRFLAAGSDLTALSTMGLLLLSCLLPALWREPARFPGLLLSILLYAGTSLLLARLNAAMGGMNGFAPYLAMLSALFGGCFLNTEGLSEPAQRLLLLSPIGLSMQLMEGEPLAWLLALTALAAVLYLLLHEEKAGGETATQQQQSEGGGAKIAEREQRSKSGRAGAAELQRRSESGAAIQGTKKRSAAGAEESADFTEIKENG